MARMTPATRSLAAKNVAFSIHHYDYDPKAPSIGLQAAKALGEDPRRVLKTLMARADGKPVCVVIASDREVSMKKLASAFGARSATMMSPTDAERLTGYHVGGISPFGQRRSVPTAFDADALCEPYVYVNAGQRGLQLRLDPCDAVRTLAALVASLTA